MYILSFDNTKIYYSYKKNKKQTLVFIHGWPHNHTVWEKEINYFSRKGYSTLAIDLRGHGKSGMPSNLSKYTMPNFAKDIKAVIDNEKIKKPILVGHSFGGMVILKFMELFSNVPKALILIDTTYENPIKDMPFIRHFNLTPLTEHLLKFILKYEKIQNKHFSYVDFSKFKNHSDFYYWIKGVEETPIAVVVKCLKDMLEFNEKKILPKIKIPTLIIEGEKDVKTPISDAAFMNKQIKDSKIVVIKKATHDTNIQKSKIVNKEILKFLLIYGRTKKLSCPYYLI